MTSIDLLLESVARDPGDDLGWLALADALDEQGDRRSEATRLSLWLRRRLDDPEHPQWAKRLPDLVKQGVLVCLPRKVVDLGSRVELEQVLIPPGSFVMGSPNNEKRRDRDEGPQRRVTVTRGFWMGIHPVTQAQWRAVTGDNPSYSRGDLLPVEQVSWDDCQAFTAQLSQRTGQRFRLPTEAEWEYACRAGTTTPFHFGKTISTDVANYDGNYTYARGKKGVYRDHTTPVGSFTPNAWGLFDVHGNILEWCTDWYGDYPEEDQTDPVGPDSGVYRMLRGGSCFAFPWSCRSASRVRGGHADHARGCGVRVCSSLD